MQLKLIRKTLGSKSTSGELHVNGVFHCFTLEDVVRMVKIPKESAIPCGKFNVSLTHSSKFDRVMPLIEDVPNYDGVRIHWGNWAKDTDGCVLVGFTKAKDFIGRSRDAFDSVYHLIENSLNQGEKVELEIIEEPEGV